MLSFANFKLNYLFTSGALGPGHKEGTGTIARICKCDVHVHEQPVCECWVLAVNFQLDQLASRWPVKQVRGPGSGWRLLDRQISYASTSRTVILGRWGSCDITGGICECICAYEPGQCCLYACMSVLLSSWAREEKWDLTVFYLSLVCKYSWRQFLTRVAFVAGCVNASCLCLCVSGLCSEFVTSWTSKGGKEQMHPPTWAETTGPQALGWASAPALEWSCIRGWRRWQHSSCHYLA